MACTKNATTSDVGANTSAAKPVATSALKIGFSQIGAESAWRSAESKSFQDEAKKRGYDLRFSDAQQKQENQIKAIRTFILQKVDAIVLAPVVETGWEPVLTEAKNAGIPVVLVDRRIKTQDDSLYATLFAPDLIEEGRKAGRWLAEKTNRKSVIVELQGTPGAAPAIDRQKGFAEVIKTHPWIKWFSSFSIPLGSARLPTTGIVFLVVVIAALYFAKFTATGRAIFALGGNSLFVMLMGLLTERAQVVTYALSGACAALAGTVYSIYTSSGSATVATGLELEAIAAVVIGGTLLSGGRGSAVETLIRVFILGIIQTIITFKGTLSSWWTRIVIGHLIRSRSGVASNRGKWKQIIFLPTPLTS